MAEFDEVIDIICDFLLNEAEDNQATVGTIASETDLSEYMVRRYAEMACNLGILRTSENERGWTMYHVEPAYLTILEHLGEPEPEDEQYNTVLLVKDNTDRLSAKDIRVLANGCNCTLRGSIMKLVSEKRTRTVKFKMVFVGYDDRRDLSLLAGMLHRENLMVKELHDIAGIKGGRNG